MSAFPDTVRPGPPRSGARLRSVDAIAPASLAMIERQWPCFADDCVSGEDAFGRIRVSSGVVTLLSFVCEDCAAKLPPCTRVLPLPKGAR